MRRPPFYLLRVHATHRKVRVIGCAACQAETEAIWQARADRGWVTDPSDPGWREIDAQSMIRRAAEGER